VKRLFCFLILAALFLQLPLFGADGSMRKPSPAEQKVLDKYVAAINAVLDQFRSEDWDENADYAVDDQVNVHPNSGRPVDIDEMFQRSYEAHPGSARYTAKIQPLVEQLGAAQDINEKMKVGAEAQKLMHVQVEVHFNVASQGDIEPPPSQNQELKIPGTAFAYKTTGNPPTHGGACILAFGHWQPLKWNAENGWYRFTFTHPVNTPYIENIVVRIDGADDRMNELLHNIDWKQVNGALTP
jgi:hypothetical protein